MIATNSQDVENFIVFGSINTFRYTNYKGEVEIRKVIPLCLRYGRTEYHPVDGWLVEVFDLDRNALRTFSLAGIDPR